MDSDYSDSDDSDEEYMDDEVIGFKRLCAEVVRGIIIARNLRNARTPCHTSERTGHQFINEILNGHPRRCYDMFRLNIPVFRQLCVDLVTKYGLKQTRHVSIEESVGILLMTLAHGCTNRFVQESFNHSGETIHRHFYRVLAAVLRMSADIIKPAANYNDDVPAHILDNPRYYPMFENYIGAIDGTHVRALVPLNEQPKYIGRKGYATQNIMDVCDFNMCFTFVWAGWEGTAHDTRIFNEALERPELQFPHPTGDKYYVVDAGYPNTRGYLAPYKGTNIRYHIPDFRRAQTSAMRAPRGPKETYNYFHSSLRNIIERTFGVWKARWALLRDMHVNFTYEHQVSIVIASMAIHNYIRKPGEFDKAFDRAQQESYNPRRGGTSDEVCEEDQATRRANDDMYMSAIRDIIAGDIMKLRR
ncbi:putative harbinger transposase-derived nuclease domain-containing protein [Helianthus debilis subsp. tardiflorus]